MAKMLQPRKAVLRNMVAASADVIEEKNAEIDRLVQRLDNRLTGAFLFGAICGVAITGALGLIALTAGA